MEDGIDWLVRHQRIDGSWGLNYHEQCQGNGLPLPSGDESDTAATGLALLPLLGAGYIHTVKSRHQDSVRRGSHGWSTTSRPTATSSPARPAWPTCTATPSGRWRCARRTGSRRTPIEAARPACDQVHRQLAGPEHRRLALLPRPGRRYLGLRLADVRTAERPHGAGIAVPRMILKGCTRYLDLAAADQHRITYAYLPGRGGLAGHDRRGPAGPPAPGLAAELPAPRSRARRQIAQRPRDIRRSGTSITGITRPSSCTT